MLKCALVLAHRCSGIGAPYFAVTSRPLLPPATSFIHPSAKKCFAEKTEGRCTAVPKLFDIFVIKYLNASTDFVARASLDLRRCYGIQRCFGLWATLGSSWTLPHELRPYLGEGTWGRFGFLKTTFGMPCVRSVGVVMPQRQTKSHYLKFQIDS